MCHKRSSILQRVEERNILYIRKRKMAIWIGHTLHRNYLLKHVSEGKIEGTGRRERRRKQLLDNIKEKKNRIHRNLKQEARDRTVWRSRFARAYGPATRKITWRRRYKRLLYISGPVVSLWDAHTFTTLFHILSRGAAAQRGPWPPYSWGSLITHNDAPQSVGLLWTSDQFVAETSTWQHTTLTTDKHPCPPNGWDSNPRSQQASGHRPTP